MRWPRIIILLIIATMLGAFFHYTLPQRDVVRIVDAQPILTEISGISRWFYAQSDSGATGEVIQRDVRIISAVRLNGEPIDYRNEDTGLFGWPPYFKINSQDLQTVAQDLRSDSAEPIWVAVTHYGWRTNLFSSFPNALSIVQVEGPDVRLIPWMPFAVLAVLAVVLFMAWRIWERFEDRVIAPFADGVSVRWSKLKDRLGGRG